MSGLEAFLAENVLKTENIKYVATKRIVDPKTKEPIKWEICSITNEEDEAIRKDCMRRVQVPGKRNVYQPELETDKYLGLLAVKCTVYPNLNSEELQNSYGVAGADKLLKKMLLPGEYQDYLAKVQEATGFVPLNDLVDEAKN